MDLKTVEQFIVNLDESTIVLIFAFLNYLIGIIVYFVLLFIPAWYGRYSPTGYGIPAKLAWFLQELPAFLIPTVIVALTQSGWIGPQYDTMQLVVLLCFILHYFQRTFIYPYLIKGGKPTPVLLMFLAMTFCGVNGYMQARGAVLFSAYPNDTFTVFRLVVGLSLFVIGMVVNMHSDHVLRNLRKEGETGYKIPHDGIYQWVSCANFFGEIVEWFGFAVASWSIVAFAFSFFTVANLVPRAITHHRWYIEKFDDYPKERKAVIPYLL